MFLELKLLFIKDCRLGRFSMFCCWLCRL